MKNLLFDKHAHASILESSDALGVLVQAFNNACAESEVLNPELENLYIEIFALFGLTEPGRQALRKSGLYSTLQKRYDDIADERLKELYYGVVECIIRDGTI